jgi:hypothetical protein
MNPQPPSCSGGPLETVLNKIYSLYRDKSESHATDYTLKVALLKSIFTRHIALFNCIGTVILESSYKNPQVFTCNSEGSI